MKSKPNRYRGLTIYAICMNLMIFVSIQLCTGLSKEEGNVRTLSRRRRYLIFPEGSSLQIAKPSTTTDNNYGDDKFQPEPFDVKSMNATNTMSNFSNGLMNGKVSPRKITFPVGYEHSHHSIYSTIRKRSTFENIAPTVEDIFHTKLHRSSRYKLYERLEKFIDAAGHDGKDCILKALCETGQIQRDEERRRASFLGELMRAIFR
ncbi:uncharacterized protein LOC119079652 [Bradysia coprophila]|uniref:uncharacterized protein LOC119079652 n=1 Tax=Bradysia coprophila TaxID=38358 RepID=UPI00187D7433|nr:uncharacterized protein LOC119079652 [Bradysia coprophila]